MPIHTSSIRDFLTRWETSQTDAYIPCRKRNFTGRNDLSLCGEVIASSGVTIGTGVDLGQQREADLVRMGVPDALIARFRPYLGLCREEAVFALERAPLSITDAERVTLDAAVHADYIRRACAAYDKAAGFRFEDIPAEAQTVIVSLFYQLGDGQRKYPDPGALKPSELRFVWQMHLKTDKELWDLSAFPGFDGAAIAAHLKDNAEGDASMTQWESLLLTLNEDNVSRDLKKRFRVYERWGYLTGQELRDAGNTVADEDLPKVFPSNVWVLGNRVIKAMINPMEGVDIPYFFYPYQIDETAFWPEGIATAIRYPQSAVNAAVRATQDNAVLSSGPIIGVNMQALADGEDPTSIQARRVLLFSRSGMNLNQAFQAVTVPSCITENLTLTKFWQEAADEMSTPRFNAGDGRVSGAGETASGLSMLMGASNILLKDHVKDFDDHVTTSRKTNFLK